MGIMVSSLLWVVQDLYHQPYCYVFRLLYWGVEVSWFRVSACQPFPNQKCIFKGLGFRVYGLGFRDETTPKEA